MITSYVKKEIQSQYAVQAYLDRKRESEINNA